MMIVPKITIRCIVITVTLDLRGLTIGKIFISFG